MKECGRNDPCPCGSGKKLKKCCQTTKKVFTAEKLEGDTSLTRVSSVHQLAHSLLKPLSPKKDNS